jgi:hypothetical protein
MQQSAGLAPSSLTRDYVGVSILGRGRVWLMLAALCSALGAGAGIARAQFVWSRPIPIDKNGGQSLIAVACPATTQCTALDIHGRLLTFDPTSPHAPAPLQLASLSSATDIACPSATECIVIGGGQEAAFNPQSPGSPAAVTIDAAAGMTLSRLACPTVTQCTAVDNGGRQLTFNPVSPGSPTAVLIDPGTKLGLEDIACPSTSQCTAIDVEGKELTFDPASTAAPSTAILVPTSTPNRIACPTLTQCTAVDSNGRELTFNPQAPVAPTPVKIDAEQINVFLGITCRSISSCTATSEGGRAVTFNPQSPATAPVVVDDRSPGGDRIGQNSGVSAVSCSGPATCTAVDGNGQELTFNPATSASPPLVQIDPGNQLIALACAGQIECTAVDDIQEVTFDPVSPGRHKPITIAPGSFAGLDGVDCVALTRCTAIRPAGQITFNPRSPGKPKLRRIDPDSDIGLSDIACPATNRCVVVDGNGGELMFDPRTGKTVKRAVYVEQGAHLEALSCPSVRQCTAVDNDGNMVSFTPRTGKVIASAGIDTAVGLNAPSGDSNDNLDGISCPTATRCTAVDTLGNEVTFNPRSPHPAHQRTIDPGTSLPSVACPSSAECVAVDARGRALLGEPQSGTWSLEPLRGATPLTDVTCQSTGECVAVDSAGNAFVGAGKSPAEVKGWLAKLLASGAASTKIRTVLKAGGSRLSFAGLYAAQVRVRWFHGPQQVASGAVSVRGAGDETLKLKLTAAGRRLLAHSRGLRVRAAGTVTYDGHTVTGSTTFLLSA